MLAERLAVDPESLFYSKMHNWVYALGRDAHEGELLSYIGDKSELGEDEVSTFYDDRIVGVAIDTVESDMKSQPVYVFTGVGYWEEDTDKEGIIEQCKRMRELRLRRFDHSKKGKANV